MKTSKGVLVNKKDVLKKKMETRDGLEYAGALCHTKEEQ